MPKKPKSSAKNLWALGEFGDSSLLVLARSQFAMHSSVHCPTPMLPTVALLGLDPSNISSIDPSNISSSEWTDVSVPDSGVRPETTVLRNFPEVLQPKDYFQLVSLISKTAKHHVKLNVRKWGEAVAQSVDPPAGFPGAKGLKMDLNVHAGGGGTEQRPVLLIMGGSHLVRHSVRLVVTGQKKNAVLRRDLETINLIEGILSALKHSTIPNGDSIAAKWLEINPGKDGVVRS